VCVFIWNHPKRREAFQSLKLQITNSPPEISSRLSFLHIHKVIKQKCDLTTQVPQHTKVLQCVAVCCSVLQCVAVCCSVLQCMWQCVALCCSLPAVSTDSSSSTYVYIYIYIYIHKKQLATRFPGVHVCVCVWECVMRVCVCVSRLCSWFFTSKGEFLKSQLATQFFTYTNSRADFWEVLPDGCTTKLIDMQVEILRIPLATLFYV